MDLVDECLKVGGEPAGVGGRAPKRGIALTVALENALQDFVAEGRVGVEGIHAANVQPDTSTRNEVGSDPTAKLDGV